MYLHLLKIFKKMLRDFDTPLTLKLWILVRYEDYDQLVDQELDPLHYNDVDRFFLDYQAVSFLRKTPMLPTTHNRKLNAMKAAVSAEVKCHDTNKRLYDPQTSLDRATFDILSKAEKIAKRILGDAPTIDQICEFSRFGPGVSSSAKTATHIYEKQISRLDVTPRALPYALRLRKLRPELFGRSEDTDSSEVFNLVQYNTWSSVPKTAKTDRPICVEPHINMALQLGAGSIIRKRLKRHGIDIETQEQVNKFLVSKADEFRLGTVDFSSASDTIAISFVKMLLPGDWFSLLNDLRCHCTKYGDTTRINEKFSSMGNGFTFELETLLFFCLAKACGPSNLISVFGDDVIIPWDFYSDFVRTAEFCGMIVNTRKSFIKSPFYESCGSDFFLSKNVRPYFFKKDTLDESSIYSLANGLRHAGNRSTNGMGCDPRFTRAWRATLDSLPETIYAGPASSGDTVVWANPGDYPSLVFPTYDGSHWVGSAIELQSCKIFWEKHVRTISVTRRPYTSISYKVPKRYTESFFNGYFLTLKESLLVPGGTITERSFASKSRARERQVGVVTRHTWLKCDAAPLL